MRAKVVELARAALLVEGSTRAVALLRIGAVLLVWGDWGDDLLVTHAPDGVALLVAVSFYVSTSLMLVGLATRFATAWAATTLVVVHYFLGLARANEAFTHHHSYLLVATTCLLALTPCGRSYSIDRLRAVRRARARGLAPPVERGELWAVTLIAAQISAVYFWGAVSKLTPGYLSGDRLLQIYVWVRASSDLPRVPGLGALALLAALASVAIEFALAFGLWFRRARPWLVPIGVAFHALIYVTLPVGVFSATMWMLYLAYLPAGAVHDVIEELEGRVEGPAGGHET